MLSFHIKLLIFVYVLRILKIIFMIFWRFLLACVVVDVFLSYVCFQSNLLLCNKSEVWIEETFSSLMALLRICDFF